MKAEKISLNGHLVDANQACVRVTNPALLHGVGLFETLRAYAGRPLLLERHIERMAASAKALNMPLESAMGRIPEAVRQVIEANHLSDARIRFTVTPPGSSEADDEPTLIVRGEPTTGYPAELYERGMTVGICERYRQSAADPLAGHKTTSYFPRLVAPRDVQDRGCGEVLWFTPDNRLAEGSMTNVFVVKSGRLRTPPLDTPVLPGVTRGMVIELAVGEGLAVEEQACTINDLLDADEVFLTNAVMEVMPVTHVERRAIADEQVGAITKQISRAYRQLTVTPG